MILSDGTTVKKPYLPKQGLMTKQASNVIFGLNATTASASSVVVTMRDGSSKSFDIIKGQKALEVK